MESKKKLKEKLEAKEIIIENLRENNDNLRDRLIEETNKKEFENEKKFLNQYDYAILVKGNRIKLWNDGRVEMGVKSLSFRVNPVERPDIMINK